jgi:predicted nucleic acid-binding protein
MVLVDTSVWVSHLRTGHTHLEGLLSRGEVSSHPFIIGELACGQINNRKEILSLLKALPMAQEATYEEVLRLVEDRKLMGCGLGYIDVHLLASSLLNSVPLWTLDEMLKKAALKLGIGYRSAR